MTTTPGDDGDPRMDGMQVLAERMLAAGCETVAAMTADGHAVLAIGDGVPRLVVVGHLRSMADAIERDTMVYLGRADVEVPE